MNTPSSSENRRESALASLDRMARDVQRVYRRFDRAPASHILQRSPENARLDSDPLFFVHLAAQRLEHRANGGRRFTTSSVESRDADWDELYSAGSVDELVAAVTLLISQPDEKFHEWGIRRSWSITDFRVLVIGTLSQILIALADRNADQLGTAVTDLEYMLDPDEPLKRQQGLNSRGG